MSERPETMHVFYSVTTDNPYLPSWYVDQLRRDLDPVEADIMLNGRWRERRSGDKIYHQYNRRRNFRDREYEPDPAQPIRLSWDFNIAVGKPLSAVVFQYLPAEDEFHIFDEVVVEGLRTAQSCDELAGKGVLDLCVEDGSVQIPSHYVVHGDAAGKHKDTRNNRSDYDIIEKFLANYVQKTTGSPIPFEVQVPPSNPPLKTRHNRVNAYLNNDLGDQRLFVYKSAPMADKGLRLTKLKKGATYAEDDTKDYQHITTAIGYGIHATLLFGDSTKKQATRYL